MKTESAKLGQVTHNWFLIDARGKILGRLAAAIAHRLRGKHKPEYTPHVDTGDFVVVINAAEVAVTGRKLDNKMYYRHSGYPGALKALSLKSLLADQPEQVIRKAVKGMMPRTPLSRAMQRKLKVYAGPEHPHAAQQPNPLEI